MIPANRFIERSTNRNAWLSARRLGVSATAVADAATPAGFDKAVEDMLHPVEVVPNEYMQFGTDSEAELMRFAKNRYGLLANDWLIAGENPEHLATPDGLSLDHRTIAECKTGGTIPKSIPRKHRDQMFWQMWCCGAEKGLYVFNQRVPDDNGWYFLGLIEPLTFWLERDDTRIAELAQVADRLMTARHELVTDF